MLAPVLTFKQNNPLVSLRLSAEKRTKKYEISVFLEISTSPAMDIKAGPIPKEGEGCVQPSE